MAGPAVAAPSRAPDAAPLLFSVPHRLFFLAGVAVLALASLWWTWTMLARAWPALPAPASAVPDTVLHALVMTCGFAPLFMFGFLFTAGPRWLGMPPPPPAAWLPGGLIAASGALPGHAAYVAAALAWSACFVVWGVKYAPLYWRPRADGRPG